MPGCRSLNVYDPLSSVAAVRETPVPVFNASTLTPGMAAAEGSVTLPVRDPYKTCARALLAASNSENAIPSEPVTLMRVRDMANLLVRLSLRTFDAVYPIRLSRNVASHRQKPFFLLHSHMSHGMIGF